MHDDIEPHVHLNEAEQQALADAVWRLDNIEFTTVGVDIGSSTSHLMFSRVHLRRRKHHLSSRFIVIERRVLWTSPIRFTPFLDDDTIDAAALGVFIAEAYKAAGLERSDVDTGAVILTGEAIKRKNAAAITALFAQESGKFVCATAGHRLECALAAHGSGAVALSKDSGRVVLNVDIGGGTTKLALCIDGRVQAVSAIAIGGRLIVQDEGGAVTRLDESARIAAAHERVSLTLGERPAPAAMKAVVAAFCNGLIETILRRKQGRLTQALMLTEALEGPEAAIVTFSGGVSEYIYGRETRPLGDISMMLAARVRVALEAVGFDIRDPGQGIRATAIGASQFTIQVSGKTIHLGDAALPLRNVPVLAPRLTLDHEIAAAEVSAAVRDALARVDPPAGEPIAIALKFPGSPTYTRLRAVAEGLSQALADGSAAPVILMIDADVGRLLGRLIEDEASMGRPVVCIDGIELSDFDYVDIGARVPLAQVVPVVIKSLLFGR